MKQPTNQELGMPPTSVSAWKLELKWILTCKSVKYMLFIAIEEMFSFKQTKSVFYNKLNEFTYLQHL